MGGRLMAVCDACSQEMTGRAGCTDPFYEIGGQVYPRVPNADHPCHDCLAPPGALHHPGCDAERCPVCLGQSISCPCGREPEQED